ncbi:thiol-disulfide oxidoreductase DCC family protein [Bacillus shivajii]|uniref:thiol-disulfide oxidoreductase DCC family protein n=1 Tax=Bacillus shivajii TaxID=1983719 RepID=UPI001CF9CB57|nr:thiol-disulfide oxidoreductase DCC family protein [Bacillus shivajii]UCZ52968.1 thiol-disulfide oxidoreductase DCC family protein [Bacillus shivajii]
MYKVILFDGECNFCDHSVQFIIKRDKRAVFKFASLQSESGQKMLRNYRIPENLDSLVVIDGNRWYTKSSAALNICKHLSGGWKLFYIFTLIPKPIRDFFYTIFAKNRYKWFGKKESCTLPSPEIRKRFL